MGSFEKSTPEALVRHMGQIASGFVSPLPQGWEHDANGGVVWARNSGIAQQVGREWALTGVGETELEKIISPEPSST